VLALTVGVFYALLYQPLVHKQEDHRLRSDQLSSLINQSRGVQRDHRQLRKQFNTLQEKIAATRHRLPSESLEAEFVSQIGDVAESMDLRILDYQQVAAQEAPSHSKTEVQFRCNGSFASICHFFHEVSQFARITKISAFDIQSDLNSNHYPFRVTFVLYYGVPSHDTSETRGVL